MAIPSNAFTGLGSSEAFKKHFATGESKPASGSPDDLQKETLAALHALVGQQQKDIAQQKRRIGRLRMLLLLSVLVFGVLFYLLSQRDGQIMTQQGRRIDDLQTTFNTTLEAARARALAQRTADASRDVEIARLQAAVVALTPPPPPVTGEPLHKK